MQKTIKTVAFFSFLLFVPFFTYGQSAVDTTVGSLSSIPTPEEIRKQSLEDFLEIKIDPKTPAPHQNTTISIHSNLTDLNRAEIFWYINDQKIVSGIGQTTLIFKTQEPGTRSVVDVVIYTNEGDRIDKQITITPLGINILWEAQTFTPPFYKGKALPSPQSEVKVIAKPEFLLSNGSRINPSELVYTWKKDNKKIADASGYGKNIFYVEAPKPFRETRLEVEVSSLDGSLSASKKIELPVFDPEIIFYENKPLEGTDYDHPIGKDFDLTERELSIKPALYFFSKNLLEEGLVYTWTQNNKKITFDDPKNVIFRQEEPGKGESRISLSVYGLVKTFQKASNSFNLKFELIEDLFGATEEQPAAF